MNAVKASVALHLIPMAARGSWAALQVALSFVDPVCAREPDLFFSDKPEVIDLAIEACSHCLVRRECLQYATDAREKFGVYGGVRFPLSRRKSEIGGGRA